LDQEVIMALVTHHEEGMTPPKGRKHGGRMEKKEHEKKDKHRRHGGKVEGKKPEHRADKRARGGRMTPKEPFTGAGNMSGGVKDSDEDAKEGDRASGGRLSAKSRNALPASDFALPGKGEGKEGKGSGSYPIPDAKHARLAKAMVSAHGSPAEKARVDAAVARKYPDIGRD
jgi:hypothetical protein